MTEQEFNAAQEAEQVNTVDPAIHQEPKPSVTLEGLKGQLDTYLNKLEVLRRGLVGCKMYLGSPQTPGAASPYPTVDLDTVEFAEQVIADTAAHSMTLTVGGFYLVVFQIDVDGATAGNSMAADVKSGATQIGYASKNAAGATDFIGSSFIAKFNGNEVLTLGAYTNHQVLNGSAHSFLSITKLSI